MLALCVGSIVVRMQLRLMVIVDQVQTTFSIRIPHLGTFITFLAAHFEQLYFDCVNFENSFTLK